MAPPDTPGLLLLNLGTPDDPSPGAVRRYLREFLSDPRVLDAPAPIRWLVLNLVILPFRPRRSAAAYRMIWTERGSPLLANGEALRARLQERFGKDVVVGFAMRYGRPSIRSALDHFARHAVSRIVVFPLYPQYSSASTGSSLERVFREAGRRWNVPSLAVVPPFFGHPAFLDARVRLARPHLDGSEEKVFLSFHGLPERHVRKSDPTGECLSREDCCDTPGRRLPTCYRAQCHATAHRVADGLGIPREKRVVCFQSRLGRDPWLRPFTDVVVREAAEAGVRRAAILSPAFVADCLETLEEIGIRARDDFRAHGGEELRLVPSLNAEDEWVEAVARIAADASPWIPA